MLLNRCAGDPAEALGKVAGCLLHGLVTDSLQQLQVCARQGAGEYPGVAWGGETL